MRKTTLITDFDNTLFDWVDVWHQSFSAMLNSVIEITGADPTELKKEIRHVHQKHGTSEYAFLLEETPTTARYAGTIPVTEVFSDSINAFRLARRNSLHLYPTVLDALSEIKQSGCKIIAYTESMAFYTSYRVRKLGLDGVIDTIFSPEDHALPKGLSAEMIRKYPSENYEFKNTIHMETPRGELKPNPDILRSIISQSGDPLDQCVYIGDSLHKDVAMAKDAGVDHAWAKYGQAQERSQYQLLREVTHWTDEDVQREKEIRERDIEPNLILDRCFSQIQENFDFGRAP